MSRELRHLLAALGFLALSYPVSLPSASRSTSPMSRLALAFMIAAAALLLTSVCLMFVD